MPTNQCLLYEEALSGNPKVSCDQLNVDGVEQHLQRMKLGLGINNVYQDDLAYGQNIMASSLPVTMASNQSAIPVTQSLGFSVGITGTVPGITVNNGVTAVSLTGTNPVVAQASTNGGFSMWSVVSLTGTPQTIKATAGQVNGYYLYNNSSAVPTYVKFYNKGSTPVLGTDVPVLRIPIPAGSAANLKIYPGLTFTSGIYVVATSGLADNNTVFADNNQVTANVFYN